MLRYSGNAMIRITDMRFARRSRAVCLLGACLAVFVFVAAEAQEPPRNGRTVAKVGDWRVTQAEMAAELSLLQPRALLTLKRDPVAARNFAVRWYTNALLARDAEAKGLYARQPGLRLASEAAARSLVARTYLRDLIDRKYAPTERELRQAYDLRKDKICRVPSRYRLAVLGVRFGAHASPEELALAEKRLAEMQKRLGAGDAFAEVADALSDHPQELPGGELGWVTDPELAGLNAADPVKVLEVGQRTEPIRSPGGIVIYEMLERGDAAVLPFEQCRPLLVLSLNSEFARDIQKRRMDEIAEEQDASMNEDAFMAALKQVPTPEDPDANPGLMPRR